MHTNSLQQWNDISYFPKSETKCYKFTSGKRDSNEFYFIVFYFTIQLEERNSDHLISGQEHSNLKIKEEGKETLPKQIQLEKVGGFLSSFLYIFSPLL